MVDRSKALNVRISEQELEMLQELAEERGLSQSDVVRLLIREAHNTQFGATKKTKR